MALWPSQRSRPLVATLLLLLAMMAQHTATIANTERGSPAARVRRQAVASPQLVPGPKGPLNVPIPTNIAVLGGSSTTIDKCPRDEVTMEDGSCQQLLTQGNCTTDEYVLLNPETNKGYCAPRLCPPDRIFVFSTQLCHDPRELNLCPPGRELYESSYGTPVCQCPDGTYEGDEDLDDDVCEPLLGQIPNCPAGQVFWFRDFNLGPECIPDPCDGLNLNRGPNDLPFLPSLVNGRCFQMGASDGVCPKDTWYGLATDTLKGVCASLEEFGYNVFDADTLQTLIKEFGPPITGNNASPLPTSVATATAGGVQVTAGVLDGVPQVSVSGPPSSTSPQVVDKVTPVLPKPIEQISQIQQQIGLLQQQLNQLQQTLGQDGMTMPMITTPRPKNLTFGDDSEQRRSLSLFADVPTTTVVIKARLESQFSDNIIPPTTLLPLQGQSSQPVATLPQPTTTHLPSSNVQVSSQPPWRVVPHRRPHQTQRQSPFTLARFSTSQPQSLSPQNNQITSSNRAITVSNNNNPQNIRPQSFQPIRRPQNFSPHQTHQSTVLPQYSQPQQTRRSQVIPDLQILDFGLSSNSNSNSQQFNSLEQLTAFGQQFPSSGPGFRQLQPPMGQVIPRHQLESHGGGPAFIPNDSFENHFAPVFSPQAGRRRRSVDAVEGNRSTLHARRRRSPLPHATPSNVFESRLLGCRGGAVRDINAKCRNVILPSRLPKRRPVRAAPPVRPNRPCNGAFNILRICVSAGRAQSSVNAFALG